MRQQQGMQAQQRVEEEEPGGSSSRNGDRIRRRRSSSSNAERPRQEINDLTVLRAPFQLLPRPALTQAGTPPGDPSPRAAPAGCVAGPPVEVGAAYYVSVVAWAGPGGSFSLRLLTTAVDSDK